MKLSIPKPLRIFLLAVLISGAAVCISVAVYMFSLSHQVRERFSGKRWDLPARIYARPLDLYPGMTLDPESFQQELKLMLYRVSEKADTPGTFRRTENTFTLTTRAFMIEAGKPEASKKLRVVIQNGKIASIIETDSGNSPALIRLDPAMIGSFYPTNNEDRILVRLRDVSPFVIQSLLAVEDRKFYQHHGVNPLAILRAMIANIRYGRTVQGGSTLTQQLAKNFFLTPEKTLKRKIDEMCIAMLLEIYYDKNEILEAYLNEVYLGQDGDRAIHGFGLGSFFYFGRPLEELRTQEIALMIGMLRGASHYDPRRSAQRARDRRNLILKILNEQGLLSEEDTQKARESGLGVIDKPPKGSTSHPAYTDLVKRQLLQDYREEDLRSEGLKIFTAFDPQVQLSAEKAASEQMKRLESQHRQTEGSLEAAAIVTSWANNEVLAMIGGKDTHFKGFNRALDAKRPIGSLIKPVVYLTALEQPQRYTLMRMIEDAPFQVRSGAAVWSPQNYDRQYHGMIPVYQALTHSYNIPTVKVGMDIGVDKVMAMIRRLGVENEFPAYPSALLGTPEMSVFEVARLYQTIASGGFSSPIRAIRSVHTQDGTPLQRYPLSVNQSVDSAPVYLVSKILQAVCIEGTAASLGKALPNLNAAGKTGTTDELKDSWFAGFTGNRLAVVWLGKDDNTPCGLTGASGALQVWIAMMSKIANEPLDISAPENIEWVTVDNNTGLKTEENCDNAISIPFIVGSSPKESSSCHAVPPLPRGENSQQNKPSLFKWFDNMIRFKR